MFTSLSGKKSLFLIIAVFLFSCSLSAKSVTGSIVYIEGSVDLYRDGELFDWELVDIGFGVEEFDLIETGSDGIVEIDINLPSGSRTSLLVKSNTAFYFEMEEKSGRTQTSFQMLSGAISFKVQKLSGKDTMNVHTESAVMGVRGTKLEILISPEGGILVLCVEGAVSCKDNQGREQYSIPGIVVDKVPDKLLSSHAIDESDLVLYRKYWVSARDEVFRSGANVFIQGYAKQFLLFEPKFSAVFAELVEAKATLERYGKDTLAANPGTLFKAKASVSPGVVKMRSILPVFEMIFYRLKELEKYHAEGLGRGSIESDLSSVQFFNEFSSLKNRLSRQMAEARYFFKLYNNIHKATGGGPSILDTPFGGGGVPLSNPPSGSSFGN